MTDATPPLAGHAVTVTGLITDHTGRLLMLRPTGTAHPWWFLPGCHLPDGWAPVHGLGTALYYQLHVRLPIGPLHVAAYCHPASPNDPGEFVLLFDLGTYDPETLIAQQDMRPGDNISLYRWVDPVEAAVSLEPYEWERVAWALGHPRAGRFFDQQPHADSRVPGGAHDANDAAGRPTSAGHCTHRVDDDPAGAGHGWPPGEPDTGTRGGDGPAARTPRARRAVQLPRLSRDVRDAA